VLKVGQFANVSVRLSEALCLELFSNYRMLARVVLRRNNHTIAAGTIMEMIS
jgi:translation elongation factor EF-1alpha